MKKPWGHINIVHNSDNYRVIYCVLKPKHRTSFHYHNNIDKHWVMIKGNGLVQKNKDINILFNEKETLFFPKKTLQRISNKTESEIEFLEIQVGINIKEKDIKRVADDYCRT